MYWFICACYNLYALLNLSVACQKASAEVSTYLQEYTCAKSLLYINIVGSAYRYPCTQIIVKHSQCSFKREGTTIHDLYLLFSNISHFQLCVFSQQLIHRQVKFTALELFTIDAALLLAVSI